MIRMAFPHPSGAAVTILLRCPSFAWVLLRRTDDAFAGYPDPAAEVVSSGDGQELETAVLDFTGLTNGITVWYRILGSEDGVTWAPYGDSKSVTPGYESQPQFHVLDPVELVRERVEVGLAGELALGTISHPSGAIPVLRAPPLFDSVTLPCVTVLLESRSTEHRFVGDNTIPDWYDPPARNWEVYQGWLDRSRIQICGWSLNAEERAQLRHAIERILLLNIPIFDAVLTEVDVSQSDQFDTQSYNVPVYQAVFDLSALHPAIVRDLVPPITATETYPYGERITLRSGSD